MKRIFTTALSMLLLGLGFVGCTEKDTDAIKEEQEKTTVAIDCKSTEVFTAFSQTKKFHVIHTINFAEITAPEGWTVSYSSDSLTVVSPSSASGSAKGTITVKGEDNIGRLATATMNVVRREADAAAFGDETFRDYLVANFDTNKDDVLSSEELEAITVIDIRGKELAPNFRYEGLGITSLDGIEALTSLTELYCSNNAIGKLDLSANTNLKVLHCYFNNLDELDLANNTKLTEIYCFFNNLTNLNLSKCPGLVKLACQNNFLTEFRYASTSKLTELNIANNAFTTFDATKHTALVTLDCSGNQLVALDITKATALTALNCSKNQIATIDLSKSAKLQTLNCTSNKITAIDASTCKGLQEIAANSNLLTSVNLSGCTALERAYLADNAITDLNIKGTANLVYLGCWNNALTAIDLTESPKLEKLACNGNKIVDMDVHAAAALKFLQCYDNPIATLNISSLANIENIYLTSGKNSISREDVTEVNSSTGVVTIISSVYVFTVTGTKLTGLSLDASGTHFTKLAVTGNEALASLDITKNTDLTYIDLNGNALSSIDVSNNTKVTNLLLHGNKLTSVNVKGLSELAYLTVYNNSQLKELSLEGATPTLAALYIKDKSTKALSWSSKGEGTFTMNANATISELKLNTKDTQIKNIICNNNAKLNVLDITECPQLVSLQCLSNNLSTLDISACPLLETLVCNNNSISSVDLSNNAVLSSITLSNNKLTNVNMSKLAKLNKLYISGNYLTVLDLSANTSLEKGTIDCTENPNMTDLYLPAALAGKAITITMGSHTIVSYK